MQDPNDLEESAVRCPYCGEVVTLASAWDQTGRMIEDCPVCCHPIEIEIRRDEWGDPHVTAERADGF